MGTTQERKFACLYTETDRTGTDSRRSRVFLRHIAQLATDLPTKKAGPLLELCDLLTVRLLYPRELLTISLSNDCIGLDD